MIHPERVLDVDRAFAFNAATAIPRHGETVFDRFFQPLVDTREELFLGLLPHRLIISYEQAPRCIKSK